MPELLYWPAKHDEQAEDPAADKSPPAHCAHVFEVLPVEAEYQPAKQSVQAAAPVFTA
jgi:hypothetical protein